MSKQLESIDSDLADWIKLQKIFFVGTAPLSSSGHINLSPKGGDTLRVLGEMEVVYQDFTGSGAETAAHLRENGRIIIMLCAFEGAPRIARFHGTGTVILRRSPRFEEFERLFPKNVGTRAFIHVHVTRISTSCGYSAPLYKHTGDRDTLDRWAEKQGPAGLAEYRTRKNQQSIDGLPALQEPI